MKRILSILLVLLMVAALSVGAFADNAHAITITNTSEATHTYDAYQVFAGDYVDGKLTNITWGSGVKGDALLAALKADEDFGKDDANIFKDCTDAEDVAEAMNGFTTAQAKNFADTVGANLSTTVAGTSTATAATAPAKGYTYEIPVTGDGYYFIKDAKDPTYPTGSKTEDTLTDYILQVVGDVTVVAKSDTITVKKTVATGGYACGNTDTDHTHTIADCGLAYADANTAQVGDIVSFKLESTVPEEAAQYDYFYFIFGDTLSKGLTFKLSDANMKVTIGGTEATKDTDYTVSTDYNGYTFAVALVDAKKNAGKDVVVTYEATVNKDAVVTSAGNPNEVVVEFSKDPNKTYGGTTSGIPASDSVKPDGKTPADKTKTFVTEFVLKKVDSKDNSKALAGAEFAIKGITESVVVHSKEVFTEDASGTYYLLKDGKYTETAPQAEEMVAQTVRTDGGYVVCKADDSNVAYKLGGKYYRVATATELEDNTIALFKHMESNEYLYESTTVKYTKTTSTDYECTPEVYSLTGTTPASGLLTATGLNAGTYTVTELVAPEGYNLLGGPVTIKITCKLPTEIVTGDETCTWTVTVDGENHLGGDILVENSSGSVLPSTGGMGTTIFYIVGSLLVVGAVVLFVTKRRMSAKG